MERTSGPESLLAHGRFVRRIARSLLFDEHRVDDVVQETWLAALERPPRTALRAWLGTVVRNFSLRALRGEGRRARRELAAARPEAVPSTEEIASREAARRVVVEAVLALEEPHRSAILLRFYEGLPPRAIARRLGIPVETVRSRVKRGIELLRARLDREHMGERRAWCVALVPLALSRPAEAAGLIAIGSIVMNSAVKIGIAAALVMGAYVAVRPGTSPDSREDRREAVPAVAAATASRARSPQPTPAVESEPLLEATLPPKRIPAGTDSPPESATSAPSPALPVGVVFGRVTDRVARPVEGAEVKLSIPIRRVDAEGKERFHFGRDTLSRRATTDARGLYRFELPKGGRIQLLVDKEGLEGQGLNRDLRDPPYEERVDFVLQSKRVATIRGRLLDLSGGPLPPDDIRFLFPDLGAGSRPALAPQGASGIWAMHNRRAEGPESEEARARIDPDRATFEIEARAEWKCLVAAYFRGEEVVGKPWEEGDPEVEFRLDPAALRGKLGSLEVRGVDAATRAAAFLTSYRLRRPEDLYFFRGNRHLDAPEALVAGLRAGRYEIAVRAEEYAEACAWTEVHPGETTRVEIPLRRPAAVRLRLVPLERWLPGPADRDLSFWDAQGRQLACASEFHLEAGETFLKVPDAPPGGCWVVLEGNAMRLDLSSGESRDLDFRLLRPRLLKTRYRPDPLAISPGGGLVVTQRLFLDGFLLARHSVAHLGAARGESVELSLEAPPGRYTLELAPPGRPAVRQEVTIGEGDVTEVAVDGR